MKHATLRYAGGDGAHFCELAASFQRPTVVVGSEGWQCTKTRAERKEEKVLLRRGFTTCGEETTSFDAGVEAVPYEHLLPLTEELATCGAPSKMGTKRPPGVEG